MENVLKYKNSLNNLKLGNMTTKEQDIFFSLLYILRKSENCEAEINFIELRKMIGSGAVANKYFLDTLKRMVKKFHQSVQEYEFEDGKYLIFNVLDDTIIDTKNNILKAKLKESFRHLLEINEDTKEYLSINLKEMCALRSSYSKIFYRYIKQWETVGIKNIKIKDFKEMLGIGEGYKFSAIDIKVLNPILKELSPIFLGLNIEKIKSNSRGGKVESLTFSWQIPEKKKKADKYKKEKIQEAPIRKKQGLGEEDLKKYEAEKRLADIIETNLDSKVITKESSNAKLVSPEQFEEMYREYLEENGISHARGIKLAFERSIASKYKIAN